MLTPSEQLFLSRLLVHTCFPPAMRAAGIQGGSASSGSVGVLTQSGGLRISTGLHFFKKTFFFLFSEPLASERQPVRFMIALYQVRSSHTPSQPTLFIAPLDSSLNCSLHAQ